MIALYQHSSCINSISTSPHLSAAAPYHDHTHALRDKHSWDAAWTLFLPSLSTSTPAARTLFIRWTLRGSNLNTKYLHTDTKPAITFHAEYQVQTLIPKSLMTPSVLNLNTMNLRVTSNEDNVALISPIGRTHRCHLGPFITWMQPQKHQIPMSLHVIPLVPIPAVKCHIVQQGSPCCFQTGQMSQQLNKLTSNRSLGQFTYSLQCVCCI